MNRLIRPVNDTNAAYYDSSSGRWWSYAALQQLVSDTLAKLRTDSKALVFLFCENNIGCIAAYLACLEACHAVALLNPELDSKLQRNLIDIYDPAFLIGSDGTIVKRASKAPGIHPDLAVLLTTSGSTGSPKLVRLSYTNLVANAEGIQEALHIGPEDRPITSLGFHYSYGLSVINSHLIAGAAVVLARPALMSNSFWDLFRELECTSMAGVPYSYTLLRRLDIEKLQIPSLRVLTQAGGKMQDDLIRYFHMAMTERGGKFYVMYGQTEATARISILPAEQLPAKLGSVGKPLRGGAIEIIDGELVYTGPNVMMGYAACPEDLALGDVLRGRLKTGDLGHLDEHGFLYVDGRLKRVAKLFGHRISLDEVEELLRAHGPTAALEGGDRLVVFGEYQPPEGSATLTRELARKLMLHPSGIEYRFVPRLPLTANGKTDYSALRELL